VEHLPQGRSVGQANENGSAHCGKILSRACVSSGLIATPTHARLPASCASLRAPDEHRCDARVAQAEGQRELHGRQAVLVGERHERLGPFEVRSVR
jgi:hypothetical protein